MYISFYPSSPCVVISSKSTICQLLAFFIISTVRHAFIHTHKHDATHSSLKQCCTFSQITELVCAILLYAILMITTTNREIFISLWHFHEHVYLSACFVNSIQSFSPFLLVWLLLIEWQILVHRSRALMCVWRLVCESDKKERVTVFFCQCLIALSPVWLHVFTDVCKRVCLCISVHCTELISE